MKRKQSVECVEDVGVVLRGQKQGFVPDETKRGVESAEDVGVVLREQARVKGALP
jgi:hypothetical protein